MNVTEFIEEVKEAMETKTPNGFQAKEFLFLLIPREGRVPVGASMQDQIAMNPTSLGFQKNMVGDERFALILNYPEAGKDTFITTQIEPIINALENARDHMGAMNTEMAFIDNRKNKLFLREIAISEMGDSADSVDKALVVLGLEREEQSPIEKLMAKIFEGEKE